MRTRRTWDAKSAAITATFGDHSRLFLKVTEDEAAAAAEYRCLRDLHAIRGHFPRVRVPAPVDLISEKGWSCLVLEHVGGITLKQHTERRRVPAPDWDMFHRAVASTAELHVALSAIEATQAIRLTESDTWATWIAQARRTFAEEAGSLAKELPRFSDAFTLLVDEIRGRWQGTVDVYKDANPANWILSGGALVAVDFETTRLRPWVVDVINVGEYQPRDVDLDRTQDLVKQYLASRRKIDPGFRGEIARSVIAMTGVARHNEQVLHRSRDILRGARNPGWHFAALTRHRAAMEWHARNLKAEQPALRNATSELAGIARRLERSLKERRA